VPHEQEFQSFLLCFDIGNGCEVFENRIDFEGYGFDFQLAGLNLGKVEDVIDDAEQCL